MAQQGSPAGRKPGPAISRKTTAPTEAQSPRLRLFPLSRRENRSSGAILNGKATRAMPAWPRRPSKTMSPSPLGKTPVPTTANLIPTPHPFPHNPLIFRDTSGAAATGVRSDSWEGEGRASPWAERTGHAGGRYGKRWGHDLPSDKVLAPRGGFRLTFYYPLRGGCRLGARSCLQPEVS